MPTYRCAHCGRELGPAGPGTTEPTCPDHPLGIIETFTDADQ